MRNIFLLYMPPGNAQAMAHYHDTVQQRVPLSKVAPFLTSPEVAALRKVFGDRPMAVWGSVDSPRNRSVLARMQPGDDVLIVEGSRVRFLGKVALKTINPPLSRQLWANLNARRSASWDQIYFIANAVELDLPFAEVGALFGYKPNLQLRGLTGVRDERLAEFYEHYDDLYSVLVRLSAGAAILQKPAHVPQALADSGGENLHQPVAAREISEHVRIQCKLALLGLKAGEKVWIPSGDQTKVRNSCSFTGFETEFSAGIDVPKSYFENIDVVWNEEFRIKAAFEVEHSTQIYSGLLRFADLNYYAPNNPYPMFIVAPAAREQQVRDQVERPAFLPHGLKKKVRFLSYEDVDEVDRFFASSDIGMSVDILFGRARRFA